MAYYDLARIKADLGISGSELDTVINNLGAKSDSEVDEDIKIQVSLQKNVATLPQLPLNPVPTIIKEASDSLVKQKFFLRPETKDTDSAKIYLSEYKDKIAKYLANIGFNSEVVGFTF